MNKTVLTPTAQRAGRFFAWLLVGVIIVALLGAVWVTVRGALAYRHLERIQVSASDNVAALTSDPSAATSGLGSLAADAADARDLTSDPVWATAERLPWIGPQLSAFHTIASSADELFSESVLPLAAAANGMSMRSLEPVGGQIDTGVLERLVEPARAASERATAAAEAAKNIDRTPLLGVVSSAVERATKQFVGVAGAIDGLSRTSQLLPEMLGKDGPRNYLLLVQNNAEWRSLGGITGTAILVHTDKGAIKLVDTRSATSLVRDLADPIVSLSEEVTQIYGTKPARYFHNLTQIPDFTTDGPIAREMYRSRTGIDVDGVIAVDPVVLSYVLKSIGPVTLPTGDSLTDANAVQLLLNEVYLRYPDPATQDAVFASAAGSIFQGIIDGRGSTEGLISALARASEERRLFIWSADAAEQAVVDGTTIAGRLPETDTRTARFGVFLNDGTGSKMSYYVQPRVVLTSASCSPVKSTGEREFTLRVTLSNNAPADAASSLPPYITGEGTYGTPPGDANVVSNVYLPDGFAFVSAATDDGSTYERNRYEGRDVLTFGTNLAPGASVGFSLVARSFTGPAHAQALVTPTADAALDPTVDSACGLN
jgi:hypothetical protein